VDNLFSADPYANRFLYTGREFLKEANLYDYRNRVYSAELGRFLQTDPIRFEAGDGNLYRYVGNNSTRYIDPFGEVESSGDYRNIDCIEWCISYCNGNPNCMCSCVINCQNGDLPAILGPLAPITPVPPVPAPGPGMPSFIDVVWSFITSFI
jgi:RHS repeat-associated protein